MHFLKRAIGPLIFTVIFLMIVNFLFELNFGFIQSIKSAGDEIEMSDIYYSKIQNNEEKIENRIVLVNIDTLKSRAEIAKILNKIDSCNPAVIGVDIYFPEPKINDPFDDFELIDFAKNNQKAIYACGRTENDTSTHSFFLTNKDTNQGFADLEILGKSLTHVRSIVNKTENNNALPFNSFSLELIKRYSPATAEMLKVKNQKEIQIKYSHFVFPDDINDSAILQSNTNQLAARLNNKIIIIGSKSDLNDRYRVPNAGYEPNEDLFVTMSGMEIHALATAMLLNNITVSKLSFLGNLVFMSIVFFIFFFLFYYLFEKYDHYFKLIGRFVILFASVVLLFLYVTMMKMGVEFELSYSVFLIIFIFEMLELYHPIMNLLKKIKIPFVK